MGYKKTLGTFLSIDGEHNITYYIYTPDGGDSEDEYVPPRAVLQLTHGMCEYIERYEEFAKFLTARGVIFCGADHLGHGASVSSPDDFGYFGGSYENLIDDQEQLRVIMRKRYRSLPYIMLGHSMGSFVARAYIAKYKSALDGVIICGTAGSKKNVGVGIFLSGLISKIRGGRHRSKLLHRAATSGYNSRFSSEKDERSWLSKSEDIRRRYDKDEKCNFMFTAEGYNELLRLIRGVTGEEWAKSVPQGLPTLLISGTDDPVGNYGKGIAEVEEWLCNAELYEIRVKMYPGCRHELLNEPESGEISEDILKWIEDVREGVIEARTQSVFPLQI